MATRVSVEYYNDDIGASVSLILELGLKNAFFHHHPGRVAQLVGTLPCTPKGFWFIPYQGTCLSCGFHLGPGVYRKATG